MTPQQIIGLGLRITAIWLMLNAVSYLGVIPNALRAADASDAIAAAYGVAGAYALGAVLLWVFPMWIAHALLPRTAHTNVLSFRAHELARVGCGILGVWLFAKAVPNFVWFLFRAILLTGSSSSFAALAPETKLEL